MDKRDWKAFCALMEAVAESVCTKPKSEAGLLLIFNALKPYALETVQRAISAHLVSSEGMFFPTAAHIVKQIRGTEEERAGVAWRTFLKAVADYDCYESVRFASPAYHYAVGMLGGWERICKEFHCLSDREIDFRGKEFMRLYAIGERVASWTPKEGKVCVPAYLAGAFERENSLRGYVGAIPAPIEVATGRKLDRTALPSGGAVSQSQNDAGALVAGLAARKRESNGEGVK